MSDERFEVIDDAYLPDFLNPGEMELVAKAGEIVYRYRGHTYGCIDHENGIACSRGGPLETPFFEIAKSNLVPVTP